MKQGLEYAFSREKRTFDVSVAAMLLPAAYGGRLALGALLRHHSGNDSDPVFSQSRIGRFGEPFIIQKLRTMKTDNGESINLLSDFLRRYGIDEVLQAHNIMSHDMSAVGYRPLLQRNHEAVLDRAPPKLVDRWKRIVLPTKPGLLSSFALLNHQNSAHIDDRAEQKLESDIRDVMDGSLAYDAKVIGRTLRAALQGDM